MGLRLDLTTEIATTTAVIPEGDSTGGLSCTATPYDLKQGDIITISSGLRGDFQQVELDDDFPAGSTSLTFVYRFGEDTLHFPNPIPLGTVITAQLSDVGKKATTKLMTSHVHIFQNTGANGKDFLSGSNQPYNFNVNTNAVLADGDSKPNQWATKHSFYVAHKETTIVKVSGYAACNQNGEDLTLNIWSKPVNTGSSSNTNLNLLGSITVSSGASANDVRSLEITNITEKIPAGQVLIVSIKRGGALASAQWWADIDFLLSVQD